MSKKTVVIGASDNPGRYSNKAIRSLLQHGHEVIPVSIKKGEVCGLSFLNSLTGIKDVHTVTLYVGSNNQDSLIDDVISLNPLRVIFNPGTENREFENKLEDNGIQVLESCTLVMLATDTY